MGTPMTIPGGYIPVVTANGPQWPSKKIQTTENTNKCGPSMATSSGHYNFHLQWAPNGYRLATSTKDLLHMFIHEM